MNYFVKVITTAVACAVAVWLLPGLEVVGPQPIVSFLVFALILSLVNTALKPILRLIGLPITILTLGLFSLIINAILLGLSSSLSIALFGSGVYVASPMSAFFGAIIISVVSSLVNGLIGKD